VTDFADVGDVILIDSWSLRRWLLWPWCARRGHRVVFYLPVAWNGVISYQIARCSCGRSSARQDLGRSITIEQYQREQGQA
jgi:hypothetical protein